MERRRKGEEKWKWIIKKWKGEKKGVGMMVGGKGKGERKGNDGKRERRMGTGRENDGEREREGKGDRK